MTSAHDFPIQKQVHRTACIAASASSLFKYRNIAAVDQNDLDALIQRRMAARKSGLDALAESTRELKLPCHVVVVRPLKDDLQEWVEATAEAQRGFLITHFAGDDYHITVVFKSEGSWYKADPGTATITAVEPWGLNFGYAGDVALVIPTAEAIAVIGWGSLVWNPGDLPMHRPWFDDGPILPVEFARISSDGRVTLVLCDEVAPSRCWWALSKASTIEAAQQHLAAREGTVARNIHTVDASKSSEAAAAETIRVWARDKQLAGAVWTGLSSNWNEKRGCDYRPEDAIEYLAGLTGETAVRARQYVENAPEQVRTPARTLFESRLGWFARR